MAVFKSLLVKDKSYVFKFAGNETLEKPARAVFARFPLPDEYFLKSGQDARYGDIDFKKVGKKNNKEVQKLFAAFLNSYLTEATGGVPRAFSRVDGAAFVRECVDHFENLSAVEESGETREIKSVGEFLGLPAEAVYDITRDLYDYARNRDAFTMGE
ncbi:MAG: hypothetical protein LBH85_01620 [Treponema sp.]|jgi:hypothetical protein|nr:hypothetical protein [Treponema sp.]